MRQPLSIDVQSPLYTHPEVTTQSPDGDPHPTHLGHPHSHFVLPSFEAKPELLVCSGTRLDGDSSGHFTLGARRRSIGGRFSFGFRSEEHTSELQSRFDLVCRLLLEKK